MSGRIKGITIVLDGDATGLQKALREVESETKKTQTSLKDVNRLLKLDPSNTQLLAQKQKLLQQEISTTKQKLDVLKKANEQASGSVKNYDAWKKAYEPIGQEIDKTKKKITDLKTKMSEMEKSGKVDTEEYKQLQTELTKSTSHLKELKAQAKAVSDEFGNPISTEQYDAIQREIAETEQQLKKLEETAGSSSAKLSAMSEKAKTVSEKTTEVGKKLLPVSAGIAAVGAAAVKTSAEFDSSMSNVEAISGATGSDMEKLRDKAREMGAKTKFSAQEAGDAMGYMAMAGWKTKDMLNGIDGIMNLAAASGEDLAQTSDIVTDGLTAFGLSAKDSGRMADVMAAASSNANTNVSLMGETFKYCASVAGSMGYSMEDVSVAIGLMANAGIKGSMSGTALKNLFTNMAKPTDDMSKAMEVLGVSLDDGNGHMKSFKEVMDDLRSGFGQIKIPQEEYNKQLKKLNTLHEDGTLTDKKYNKALEELTTRAYGAEGAEKAKYASMLAGKESMAGLLAIVNASTEDYDKLTNAIYGADGSAQKMADTMNNNLSGQLTILKSALQELAISIGEILMPYLLKAVKWVQDLVGKLNAMSDTQKKVVVVIGLIVAAVAPLLLTIGKVAGSISAILNLASKLSTATNVISMIEKLQGVLKAFFAFLAANPIVLIITGIVVAIVLLYTKCEWFRNGVNTILTTILNVVKTVGTWIVTFFTQTIPSAFQAVISFFQSIPEWWNSLWTGIGTFFTNIWQGIINNPVIKSVANMVISLWKNAAETLSGIWDGIKTVASNAWELLKNIILGPVLIVIDLVTGDFKSLKSDLANIWKNISQAGKGIWNGLKQILGSIVSGMVKQILILIRGMKETAVSICSAIKDGLFSIFSKAKELVVNVVKNMKEAVVNGIKNMVNGIKERAKNIGTTIIDGFKSAIDFLKNLPSQALQWGRDFIDGLVNGIKNSISKVTDAVKGIGNKIRANLHFSVPDEGPLKDYESWMPDFMEGLSQGIMNNIPKIQKAVSQVAKELQITTVSGNSKSKLTADMDYRKLYQAVKSGVSNNDQKIVMDGRVVGRTLRGRGVVFQ